MRIICYTILCALYFYGAGECLAQALSLPADDRGAFNSQLSVSGDALTVEAFFRLDRPDVGFSNIVSRHTGATDVNYLLRPQSFQLTTISAAGTTRFHTLTVPYNVNLDQWYHSAATYDGTTIKLFINGCLVDSKAATGNIASSGNPTYIGNGDDCVCEQLYGDIDEVRIWSRARTEAELQQLELELTNPAAQVGLEAYYKFNNSLVNSQGNSAFDLRPLGALAYSSENGFKLLEFTEITVTPASCTEQGSIVVETCFDEAELLINGMSRQFGEVVSLPEGTHQLTISEESFCTTVDSLVTIEPNSMSINSFEEVRICTGDEYLGRTDSELFTTTYASFLGCDSVVVTNLIVEDTIMIADTVQICAGESFLGYTATGVYTETAMSSFGCDSTYTLNLFVSTSSTDTLEQQVRICTGDTYLGRSTSGTFVTVLVDQFGCDSTILTDLLVQDTITVVESVIICEGESYQGQTETGSYSEFFISSYGCDSVETLELVVEDFSSNPTLNMVSICSGDTYRGWSRDTIVTESLVSRRGCDSLVLTQLSVSDTIRTRQDTTLCVGEDYLGFTETGVYLSGGVSTFGCDSVHTLNLTVEATTFDTVQQVVCRPDTVSLPLDTMVTTSTTSNFGCEMRTTTHTVYRPEYFVDSVAYICGVDSFAVYDGDPYSVGMYKFSLRTSSGCDSVITFEVASDTLRSLYVDTMVCGSKTFAYLLPNGYLSGLPSTSNHVASLQRSGLYDYLRINSNGCVVTDTLDITLVNDPVYPTAFSPNNDLMNDFICFAEYEQAYNIISVDIFNRWGEIVYRSIDSEECWDGYMRGQILANGIYVALITYEDNSCQLSHQTADIMLLR